MLFANNGFNVIFNYCLSESEVNKTLSRLNKEKIMAIKADVSNYNDVKNMVRIAKRNFGDIDILINNAGIAEQKLFIDISEADWDKMFDVNVKGMYNCIKSVLPDMLKRKFGKIINISSIWGLVGASCEVHYSASKAAVIGLTKSLAKEVGPSNIQVNCVAPGIIKTDMISNLNDCDLDDLKNETPLRVIGQPSDIANLIYFLASEKANFITGQVISSNGGFVI